MDGGLGLSGQRRIVGNERPDLDFDSQHCGREAEAKRERNSGMPFLMK